MLSPENGLLKAASVNEKNNIVKKPTAGGGSNYKNLPDGTYSVTAKKPGFKDVTITVNVVNGKMMVLEIIMEKL